MAVSSPLQTIRLTTTAEGLVTCPQCQYCKRKSFAAFRGKTPVLRVKCGCGAVFPIAFSGTKVD